MLKDLMKISILRAMELSFYAGAIVGGIVGSIAGAAIGFTIATLKTHEPGELVEPEEDSIKSAKTVSAERSVSMSTDEDYLQFEPPPTRLPSELG